jgi:hypothetical protein
MNDPYFSTDLCVSRLYKEYIKHNRLIVAVDFDDTVYDWKSASHDYPKIFELLLECQNLGFYIVVFTASKSDRYDMIKDYMLSNGIEISSINKNPIELPFGNNGKIYYNILLDDRAGICQAYEILRLTVEKIKINLTNLNN